MCRDALPAHGGGSSNNHGSERSRAVVAWTHPRSTRASPALQGGVRWLPLGMAPVDPSMFFAETRRVFGGLFGEFGLIEIGTSNGDVFSELVAANRFRAVTVGIDQAQDYRVYVRVGVIDADGQPARASSLPATSADVVSLDLEYVAAQAGRTIDGFGSFGAGSPDELEAALVEVSSALREVGARLVEGDEAEWDRLTQTMVDRLGPS
jgi:hypothetical protein